MPTLAPFALRNISLTLVKSSLVATAPRVEYRCTLNQAQLTPAAATGAAATYETFCETFNSATTESTWTLDLGGFQAFADANDLSMLMFDDENELYTYVLTPVGGVVSPTNPGFTGEVRLKPSAIGGTANQYASYTVSLPCEAKPVKSTVPIIVAITGVTAGAPGAYTPANATPPADLAALKADAVIGDSGTAKPTLAWGTGEFIILGDSSHAYWDASAWLAGEAP